MEKEHLEHNYKDYQNRLASIEGHIGGIRKMVDERKSCQDLILQLYAVEKSVNKLAKLILKEHLNNCVKESIERGEVDLLAEFNSILDNYLN